MTDRQDLGAFGERIAGHRLESEGLAILARNVRAGSGEIDLIARDGDTTVFVEVRTRRAGRGGAGETLVPAKLRRMRDCALAWCEANEHSVDAIRLDVVSIDVARDGRVLAVEHFEAVETPEW